MTLKFFVQPQKADDNVLQALFDNLSLYCLNLALERIELDIANLLLGNGAVLYKN